jgi:hypothetical protein
MTETVKRVTVISPSINAVKVRVNSGLPPRVQSIQYLNNPLDFEIRNATDVEISNNLTGRGVLTYNQTTQEFVVQDLPRLDGGTY